MSAIFNICKSLNGETITATVSDDHLTEEEFDLIQGDTALLIDLAAEQFYKETGIFALSRSKWLYGECTLYSDEEGEKSVPFPKTYFEE